MGNNKEREVIIDYQIEDRERLNAIGSRLNHSKKRTFLYNDLKQALKEEGENVEHVPHVIIKVKPYQENIQLFDVRAYIYETKKCHSRDMMVDGNSHVVQISICNENSVDGWHNGETDFPAKVYVGKGKQEKTVARLIEDIRLDILMFYFFSLDKIFVTSDERRAFSRMKVRFVRGLHKTSYVGGIDDPEYVSMASFFHTGDRFEWGLYIKYWKELVKDIENNCVLNQCSLIGMDVFKSHPKYGQISKRRLRVLLNGLQKGEYYLIRTERKPNEESKQKEIMNRFGQYKWKTGKIKIVPARTRYTWERLEPYISMFLFKWVEQ